jgi:arylsulfatase A-like enzyme
MCLDFCKPSARPFTHRGPCGGAPTILGVAAPPGLAGRNLRPAWEGQEGPVADRPIFADTGPMKEDALRSGRYKLVLDLRTNRYELYDLIDDPRETRNLVGERPQVVERLEPRLKSFIEESRQTPNMQPSAEDFERLKALGYL